MATNHILLNLTRAPAPQHHAIRQADRYRYTCRVKTNHTACRTPANAPKDLGEWGEEDGDGEDNVTSTRPVINNWTGFLLLIR